VYLLDGTLGLKSAPLPTRAWNPLLLIRMHDSPSLLQTIALKSLTPSLDAKKSKLHYSKSQL